MKVLGFILALLGIACLVPNGAPILILFAPLFFLGAIKCFSVKEPEETIKPRSSGDAFSGGYDGRTHGDIIDLGGGQCFDSRDPDSIVDGVNWVSDRYGGYSGPNGDSIEYNYGHYNYHEASDDNSCF